MTRIKASCVLAALLAACSSREPPMELPPDRFAQVITKPPPAAAVAPPAPADAPPAPEPAPVAAAPAPPAPSPASAAQKAALAAQVSRQGVLGALGAPGSGAAVADALEGTGGTAVADAPSGIGRGAKGVGGLGSAGAGAGGGVGVGSAPRPARAQSEWPTLQGIPVPTTRRLLGAPPGAPKTLGEVARFLQHTLEERGYEEAGFFRYEDGFAIATRPERISPDARPVPERRWPQARVKKDAQSLADIFEVTGESGDRYRSFLLVCMSAADVGYQGGAQQSWGLWKTGSMDPEGDALLARPLGAQKLFAYIYELSQDEGGKVAIATSSPNTATEHLRAAGLVAFLR